MYGMVNRALEDYFLEYHGEALWLRTKAAAGIADETFLSMEQYPDAVTLAIGAAVAQELGITGAELLERIGVYWIGFASHAGYRELQRSAGNTLPTFLANLDSVHTRIHMIRLADGADHDAFDLRYVQTA